MMKQITVAKITLLTLLSALPLANAADIGETQTPIAQEITTLLQEREALVARTSALGKDRVLSILHEKDRELALKERGRGRFVKWVRAMHIKQIAREDRIPLHSFIYLHKDNAPILCELVEEVAGEYNLPTPLVILCEDETLNIEADSLSHTTGALVIGKTIALNLSRDDLHTALLHECAHINNRDLLKRYVYANVLPAIPAAAVGCAVGFGTNKIGGKIAGGLTGLASGILTHLYLRRAVYPSVMISQERQADLEAVRRAGDGEAMGRALNASAEVLNRHYDAFDEAHEKLLEAITTELGSRSEAQELIAQCITEDKDIVDYFDDLFGESETHPATEERMYYEIS